MFASAGVFALYAWFWFAGDMFTTLYAMCALCLPLFFCGHRVLRALASYSQSAAQIDKDK